jgi:AAA15 family ATPase/GTPase
VSELEKNVVRLESITISNYKNVENGTLIFREPKGKSKASILGLYGQNGSGKTAVIEAISLLQYVLRGFTVPTIFADYVNVDADHAELTFRFSITNTYRDVDYHAVYQFCIRKDEAEPSGTEKEGEKRFKATIFNEVLSLGYQGEDEKQKLMPAIDTRESGVPFAPKSKLDLLTGKDRAEKTKLTIEREVARITARSFIFSNLLLDLAKRNAKNEHVGFVLHRLAFFGRCELFVFDSVSCGLINMDDLPLFFRIDGEKYQAGGAMPLSLDEPADVSERQYEIIQRVIGNMNIVLEQLIPGLTIEPKYLGACLLEDNSTGCRVQLVSNRRGRRLPLRFESEGIKKIIAILQLLIVVFNRESITVAIDELDAGVFEYLLGELLRIISEKGKGQLIFTSHNLRPLETLDKNFVAFTTTNPSNRYIKLTNVKTNHNLRDFYYRDIILGEQEDPVYEGTNNYEITMAFREAGEALGS